MTIHKEGFPTLVFSFILLFIINAACYYFFPNIFTLTVGMSIALYLFLISFFRKPQRTIQIADNTRLLSPCDGKVVVIEKVYEGEYLKKEVMQVSIFMSPLNVHINWFPTDGVISYYKYHAGKFLMAWHPKASTENERTTVAYKVGDKEVLLRQVAGALARRIVCYAKVGDPIQQGQEMGFIKFGSRVDFYLPLESEIQVKIDEVVQGNISTIAKL